MSRDYAEPQVSFLVLDFAKPLETRLLLESLRQRVLFPHKVIYYHNGPTQDDCAYRFYQNGLVDLFMQSRENAGLGVGTRDLVGACFSPYLCYVQNDQILGRDFTLADLSALTRTIDSHWMPSEEVHQHIRSVSLAGAPCGFGVYSERANIMKTSFYKQVEDEGLPFGGAGPYHHQPWREGWIQDYYRRKGYHHSIYERPLFIDNGVWTIRDNPDGSRLHMRTDTKSLWWERAPVQPYAFPELTDAEWMDSINGRWVSGTIPQSYLKGAFNCWGPVREPSYLKR